MNYTLEQLKGKVTFTITLSKEEWNEAVKQAYAKNKSKYTLQGFRKGHVPQKVLENVYGKGVFYEEAFNIALPKYYGDALDKENEVFPVESPAVDIKEFGEDGSVTFTATVTVKPEVKLGKYKGIKIKKIEYNVTEEDIKEELKKAQDRAARLISVEDRAAQKGDTVNIDYSGSVNGEKFEGGTAEKQNLELGSGSFIPGFEEQIEGMKKGDKKDINVTFPKEYNKNLAGKDAVFSIVLHDIKKKELPKLDDEFAKDVSEFDTLEEYKKDITKKLEEQNKSKQDAELENKILEEISNASEVDVPEVMVKDQIDQMIQELNYRLMYQGMKLDDYLKYTNSTMEKLKESYKEQAQKTVKSRLVIEKVIKEEKIEVTEEERNQKIKEIAEKAKKSVEEYTKNMDPRQTEYIDNGIITDKLFNMLKENTVTE